MYEVFSNLPEVTKVFIVTILLVTALVHLRYNENDFQYGPIILTMIGIFGCFLGIALGLLHFDTQNLQASVPNLLTGIKTSFWASVCGIGAALTVKFRFLFFGAPRSKPAAPAHGATIDDLANSLNLLQQSLAGKEDSTLLSQVKLLRQESRDGLASLKSGFDDFTVKMADNNSKALIDALQHVIRDFNTKINKQFGENFKELNSAVRMILDWQEAYRRQLTEMIEQQKTTAESMSTAAARYSQLVGGAERFTVVANNLEHLLRGLETQKEHLQGSLTRLGTLLQSAGETLPRLEERLTEMTRQIQTGVQNSISQVSEMTKKTTQELQTSHAEMQRLLKESAERVHGDVSGHVRELSEHTRQQVLDLDKSLTEELTKSIATLGQQLLSLSQRFVDDYTPLTDKLRRVLNLAQV